MEHLQVRWEDRSPLGLIHLPAGGVGRRAALELDELLVGLHEDDRDDVRVLVITGLGGGNKAEPGEEGDAFSAGVEPPARLVSSRRPVVAVIDGPCRSAHLALALGADVRIAGPAAVFSLPDVQDGALPGWDAVGLLVGVVGPGRATPMVLAGAEVSAQDAVVAGLVHEVAEDPFARALALAAQLAERGPLALEYAKEAIWRGSRLAMTDALRLEADFNHLLQASADRAEGLTAFFEKRPPRFQGR